MPVIGFTGFQGSGKTLSMVREAMILKNKGMVIYSNLKLIGVDYEPLNIEWFKGYLLENKDLNNVVIMIDELHLYADSREHKSEINKVIGYFTLQTRKKNVYFLFTTQYLDTVDIRIRRCVIDDVLVRCEPIHRRIKDKNELIKIEQIILARGKITRRMIIKPQIYYSYYNTKQVLHNLE